MSRPHRRITVAVWTAVAAVAAMALAGAACTSGPPRPAALDPVNDQCASCRMVVSDPHFAAQIVAPGLEPRFYDDLHCLRDGLRADRPSPGSAVFVADHRTGEWVRAERATYVRVPAIETPMASHWIAYASDASRRADPYAADGAPLPSSEILGPGGPPEVAR